MTPLDKYLTENRIPVATFARNVGCTRQHIDKLKRGQTRASVQLIGRIVTATGGKLQPSDFIELPQGN